MKVEDMVAELAALTAERDRLNAEARQIAARIEDVKDKLLDVMKEQGVTNLQTGHGRVTVSKVTRASVDDWEQVYSYIREHDAFDLLNRQIKASAVKELAEEGETVPGVTVFELDTLRFYRAK